MQVFKRGNNESSQKLKKYIYYPYYSTSCQPGWRVFEKMIRKITPTCFVFYYKIFSICPIMQCGTHLRQSTHNLLQTQQNHNLALIIMFTTTKYCKIISSFMLFCKILSGAPFPCVVKMLKCFYYLKSSSSFLTFFNFHIICILEHIIICLVSCHMLVPIFAWWKKIQFFFIWRSYIWTNTKSNCNRNPWAAYDAL